MARRKSLPAGVQRVFLMNPAHPLRRIREVDVMIVVGPKMTWAEEARGKRHLMGTSAFMTLPSAERAKRGALVKIVESTALRRMDLTHDMWRKAEQQLTLFDQTGQFTTGRKH